MDEDGDIHTWPMLAWDHSEFFHSLPFLSASHTRARFRQWGPDKPVDFDPGVSDEDRKRVLEYIDLLRK
jgi:hypothetical protein